MFEEFGTRNTLHFFLAVISITVRGFLGKADALWISTEKMLQDSVRYSHLLG